MCIEVTWQSALHQLVTYCFVNKVILSVLHVPYSCLQFDPMRYYPHMRYTTLLMKCNQRPMRFCLSRAYSSWELPFGEWGGDEGSRNCQCIAERMHVIINIIFMRRLLWSASVARGLTAVHTGSAVRHPSSAIRQNSPFSGSRRILKIW